MSNAIAAAGVPANLANAIAQLDPNVLDPDRRRMLLERSFEMRSGRERPGRFWKIDLDALPFADLDPGTWQQPRITAPKARGLIACDLAAAARDHRDLLMRAMGSAVPAERDKFAALAFGLCNSGAFIYVPADVALDEPVEITYEAAGTLCPYTVVLAEHGAGLHVLERITAGAGATAFVCGISEVVLEENAHVTYAVHQDLPQDATVIFTRAARPAKDASITFCLAEIGAALSVGTLAAVIDARGARAELNGLFFPRGDQHVDLISTVDHHAGGSQSQTTIKSAATGRGQARYLGNIRIAPHAQGTESSLRDDALLLSTRGHIDSVPALEIAANDVKAFHGATVGALDDEQIFYMTSRGIERE
ncbi:MAG TPA: SufD family Fe-S cluster assembly protein, partial [Candidatus Baltobacteraceae bacterium]|nr:SufD family Fe-S cluster assembly protein [Candidatus Baltobacteraceae bacterium]